MSGGLSGQERRVRGLEALHVLDTPPEERFDRFTRFALVAFGVPMATISLVDRDRTSFKSLEAIPQVAELPEHDDLAARCVESGEPLLVPDAQADDSTRTCRW